MPILRSGEDTENRLEQRFTEMEAEEAEWAAEAAARIQAARGGVLESTRRVAPPDPLHFHRGPRLFTSFQPVNNVHSGDPNRGVVQRTYEQERGGGYRVNPDDNNPVVDD